MRVIVAPGWSGSGDGSRGTTSDTYFSPNSVFGTIAPVTFRGIVCIWSGKIPSCTVAPCVGGT